MIQVHATEKNVSTRNSTECTGLRTLITATADMTAMAANAKNASNTKSMAYLYAESAARRSAISGSSRSPMASSCGLETMFSPRFSKWYSCTWVSTIESTGQDSSQNPQ